MKSSNKAFSLIELLVGMTIGGIILTVVMTSYAAMSQTNLQLDAARQLQKETNFAVIRMADKIRNFPIESCDEDEILLKNNHGKFAFSEKLRMDEQPLFSENIEVKEVSFKCEGVEENPAKLQPRVQIYLKVSSKKYPKISNWVQTTISSRIFE